MFGISSCSGRVLGRQEAMNKSPIKITPLGFHKEKVEIVAYSEPRLLLIYCHFALRSTTGCREFRRAVRRRRPAFRSNLASDAGKSEFDVHSEVRWTVVRNK